jgi:flagellin-like protein
MERRGLSPVIASVILSAAVLTIGGALWAYASDTATFVATGYIEDTIELTNDVTERFVVEHISYDSSQDKLIVWVFNYGGQDIFVDTYAYVSSTSYGEFMDSTFDESIDSGDNSMIIIPLSFSVESGDEVSITIHSRRQNSAYETYYIR